MSDDDDAETWLFKFISNFPHVILDIYLWKTQSEYELFSISLPVVLRSLSRTHDAADPVLLDATINKYKYGFTIAMMNATYLYAHL